MRINRFLPIPVSLVGAQSAPMRTPLGLEMTVPTVRLRMFHVKQDVTLIFRWCTLREVSRETQPPPPKLQSSRRQVAVPSELGGHRQGRGLAAHEPPPEGAEPSGDPRRKGQPLRPRIREKAEHPTHAFRPVPWLPPRPAPPPRGSKIRSTHSRDPRITTAATCS